jgi:hypothetical protein
MFSEIQRDLLERARDRIENGNERFLCCAISSAVHSGSEVSYDTRYFYGQDLKDQIEFGIDGYSCMELWLFSEVGIYPEDIHEQSRGIWNKVAFAGWSIPVPREVFENICKMARLAWVYRALETGSLV